MDIIIKKMSLSNFKGMTKSFEFGPGKNVLEGKNATGKTTVFDAFLWCFFGKDSLGRAQFEIKNIVDGEPVHGLEHEVELQLLIDGNPASFKRSYAEKWTKKRGSQNKEFTGHETKYFIDDVPANQTEYNKRIDEISNGDVFRIVTDPRYFPGMHWEKRRSILFQMAGDIDHESIIDSVGLRDFLEGKSVFDRKKIVTARRKKINEELKEIPARIDELSRMIDESTEGNFSVDIPGLTEKVKSIQGKIDSYKTGSIDDQEALKQLKDKLFSEQSELDQLVRSAKQTAEDRKKEILTLRANIQAESAQADSTKRRLEKLREEYKSIHGQERKNDDNCPTCGQPLPPEMVQKAIDKFNVMRSEALEDNKSHGLQTKEVLKRQLKSLDEYSARLRELESLGDEPEKVPETTESILSLRIKINDLTARVSQKKVPEELIEGLKLAEKERDHALEIEAAIKSTEAMKKRVFELKDTLKKLSSEYDRLEKVIALIDKYDKALADETERIVNAMFEYVKFRMFTTQINEGIKETCDIIVNGIPYDSGLNNGSCIKAGLDFIKTYSKHIGVSAPIFIDNSESVTDMIEMDCQTIELRVVESQPELVKTV